MLCAFALMVPSGAAFASNPSEADPPESSSEGGGSVDPSSSPETPNPGESGGEQPKPATPTQPTTPQGNATSKEPSPNRQTTSPRSSNSSVSRQSTQSGSQDDTAADDQTSDVDDKTAKLTIDASTPVVTSNSGYHLSVTIKNISDDALPEGTLTVSVNDYYTFASRSDLQQWAQGNSRIQVPNQIGQVAVPSIAKGEKTSLTIDANPDQPSLKNMLSWGPKPVRIDYSFGTLPQSNGRTRTLQKQTYLNTTHTFLTRSTDGLKTANTPPMDITLAMPLTSDSWQTDGNKMTQLMTAGEVDASKIVNAGKLSQAVDQLISKHQNLQVITDPTLAQSLAVPPLSSGIMQPGDFDITTYSAINDGAAYEKAGIAAKAWNAETGVQEYRAALGDNKANPALYAWPGHGQWTIASLEAAKAQGYSTVIAPDATGAADSNTNSTIRTGKYIIHTNAGDITVLTAQDELSRLAQGKPTDKKVDGESSAAGRLARFMAQSAFYQMESPYATRNLLVCFDTSTANSESSAQDAGTLMQTVEQAPWLKLSNLGELNQAEAYLSGEKAAAMVPSSPDIHASALNRTRQALSDLTASENDIDRFNTSILDESSAQSSTGNGEKSGQTGSSNGTGSGADSKSGSGSQSGSASDSNSSSSSASSSDANSGSKTNGDTSGKSGQSTNSSTSGNADKSGKTSDSSKSNDSGNASSSTPTNGSGNGNGNANNQTDTGDAQALARQDADATAKRSKNGCDWIAAITTLQNTIALHALSTSDVVTKRMTASAQNLAAQLMNGITITPSESITVLSETAKMPVTVSNNHPYPVKVKISSLSDSMEIVTSRFATLSIPARSEAQTTFNVRVATSGTATAHLTLTDRKGDAFSAPQSTRITSTLRLSDKSGIIFIAVALVLGALGLWRQFNRKKDPDE